MNPFEERYKTLDLIELLRILDRAEEYQPIALEAAKKELDSRNPAQEELHQAKMILANEKSILENSTQRKEELKSAIFEYINPIQSEPITTSKYISVISIAFAIVSVYILYEKLPFLIYLFENTEVEWNLFLFFYSAPIVIVPLATALFWKRKKTGWTLLMIYLIFSFVLSGANIILSQFIYDYGAPIFSMLITLLFFAGSIWAIVQEKIRVEYAVTHSYFYTTIIASFLISVGLLLLD